MSSRQSATGCCMSVPKLVEKVDNAEIVLEPRAGTVGTTNSDSYLGIPEITLPGMLTLPEVRFANSQSTSRRREDRYRGL